MRPLSAGSNDVFAADPLLMPAGDYGGFTATDVQAILSARPTYAAGQPVDQAFATPLWLVTQAGLSPSNPRIRSVDPALAPYYRADLSLVHHLGFGFHADACAPGILALLQPVRDRGGLVVELGCGSGLLTRHLVDAGHRVMATDASPAMLTLARYHAANDYAVAWVVQKSLGGHAIPLDAAALRVLRRLGLLEDGQDLEALRASLEHQIPKLKGADFVDLISRLAQEHCWEMDPACPACPLQRNCPTGIEMKLAAVPVGGKKR